jgi:hypothetical protein
VALAPDAVHDGLLTVGEILDDPRVRLTAELVVLSACQRCGPAEQSGGPAARAGGGAENTGDGRPAVLGRLPTRRRVLAGQAFHPKGRAPFSTPADRDSARGEQLPRGDRRIGGALIIHMAGGRRKTSRSMT